MSEYLGWHRNTFTDHELFFDMMEMLDGLWLTQAYRKIEQQRKSEQNKARAAAKRGRR